eukprot:TRINITY_DN32602_c0_g1_i1.p1 TRINITY_DN32602_c0_g1~~TRINITY_DN32602_c0_g1_i1.p1  ORF type:complete len:510 (-),score=134.91 TRINITY_DN32602_c0_g1_i1:333-1862(-)
MAWEGSGGAKDVSRKARDMLDASFRTFSKQGEKLQTWLHPDARGVSRDSIEDALHAVFSKQNFPHEAEGDLEQRRRKWAALLLQFQEYGHYSSGNRVGILEGGDACFPEMLAAIRKSRTRVWCESYIFDNSKVGEEFYRALLAAAERGCDVVLVVDYIGSFSLRSDWVASLRQAGGSVVFFNPLLPATECVGPASFRDHRKIMICDDVGFCGGMNIHEEVGEEKYGTSKFYDVHAKLEGPCVADLADVVIDTLRETGSQVVRQRVPQPQPLPNGVYVQILQSNVRQQRRTLQTVIEKAIDAADDKVFLTTAYFFPPGFLRRALTRAPQRGVQLSLLLSGDSDFWPLPGDLLAQSHFLRRFLKESRRNEVEDRVNVHLYRERHMHAKHMSVDGVFATVGSFNFDLYSARRNLEVGVSVFDRSVALQLQDMHKKKAAVSERTCLEDWYYQHPLVRGACAIAYGCVRVSGRNLFDGLDRFQRKWLVRKAALTFQLEEQAGRFVAGSMMWGLE